MSIPYPFCIDFVLIFNLILKDFDFKFQKYILF